MADGAALPERPWWTGHELVNGVFKGGGARGVAYAGALRAVAARKRWFGSVAGASAGAITATLIAAGLGPDRIADISADALASVKRGVAKTVLGLSNAVFANDGLEEWIEAQLVVALPGRSPSAGPVSFAELHTATGIGLYVITMDLYRREPLIFHHALTPEASVSAAVVASCAIPGAFPAGRAVIGPADADGSPTVRELVDGGAWANFPWFVFTDRSFRAWLGTSDAAEDARPVWGFVLDDELKRARPSVRSMLSGALGRKVHRRFDLGPAGTSGSAGAYVMSAVLGNDIIRLITMAVVVLWGGVTLAALPLAARWLVQTLGRSFVAPFSPLLAFLAVAALALVAMLVVVVALGALAFGRVLADTVLPAGQAALGVATGVAPWVGAVPAGSADRVLTVPAVGLDTTRFAIPADLRQRAVDAAYEATLGQIDGRAVAPAPVVDVPLPTTSALLLRLVRTVLITVVVLRILVWAVSDLESQHAARGIGWLVVAAVGLVLVMGLTARKARFRASHTGSRSAAERAQAARWGLALLVVGGAVVIAGVVLGAVRYGRNERDIIDARIVAAQVLEPKALDPKALDPQVPDDTKEYFLKGTERRTGQATDVARFLSDTDYAIGERLFAVRKDPVGVTRTAANGQPREEWELAKQLTLDSFTLPIVAVLLGLGLLGSGARELRWLARDRRLGAPMAKAAPPPAA